MNFKPKICSVCNELSYLRCFDCDTIYCSAKCKIRDWDDHENREKIKKEKKPNVGKESQTVKLMKKFFPKVPVSVQERLVKAMQQGGKVGEVKKQVEIVEKKATHIANVVDNGKKIILDLNPSAKSTEQLMMNNFSTTASNTIFKAFTWSSDEEL
jgi:MYND finger